MRILITTFTFAPQANGVAQAAGVQAHGLARRGHAVTVATGRDPCREASPPGANPRVVEFDVAQGPAPDTATGPDLGRYQEFIRTFPADVIFCHCWHIWSTDVAVPALAGHPARKVLVSHGFAVHRWTPHPRFAWGLGQWLRARPYVRDLPRRLRAFDHIVLLSGQVDRQRFYDHWTLLRAGGPPCSVISNGGTLAAATPAAPDFRQVHGLGQAFMVLAVGLFTPLKNQALALRAFLDAAPDDSVLVLIGNEANAYSRRLEHLAAARARPGRRVLVLERQSRDAIRAAYHAADLVVLSSKTETQPLVLLDAMACGKPFVATDVGCVRELPGGLVVRGRRAMAAALRELAADGSRRRALGAQGLAAAKATYNWEHAIEAYDRLVRDLAAAGVKR